MNGAQAHLLTNHLPVLGTAFAALLLAAGPRDAARSCSAPACGRWSSRR